MDFTVTYHPSPDEVARALQQGLRRQLRLGYLAAPAALVLLGVVCVVVGSRGVAIGSFVAAVLFPFVLNLSIRRTARRQLAYLCVPTTLHVTGDGYECRTEQSTTTMRWSLFSQVVSAPEFWLLFVGKQCAGFLPRRAFDPEQQAELDRFIAARQVGAA
ncbi:YcxB family protein [Nonomuraea sp. NN258]|uniref:YcxB family protein n=1 Tax=Nonomuraea antri TaxID=2730852 RepID=UPI00156A139B|nr:YcxB family protein [Nonomuraea antri]NRQ31596.1 YcxB family protein [Nonomuraea antri]